MAKSVKQVRIELPKETHTYLKVQAVSRGKTLAEWIVSILKAATK